MSVQTFVGGTNYVRKFSISREGGTQDKNGRPYFFEFLKELPAEELRTKRKFETRTGSDGSPKHYELFGAIGGLLTGIEAEGKEMPSGPEVWLCLYLSDGPEDYKIECGQIDGRYSLDVMKRLLDPNFDPAQNVRLSPYAIQDKKTEKWNIGLAVMSGVDGKLRGGQSDQFPATYNPSLAGCAAPTSADFKGKTMWDFMPVAEWLLDALRKKVVPKLPNPALIKRAEHAGETHPERYRSIERQAPAGSDGFPTQPPVYVEPQPVHEFDDLPF